MPGGAGGVNRRPAAGGVPADADKDIVVKFSVIKQGSARPGRRVRIECFRHKPLQHGQGIGQSGIGDHRSEVFRRSGGIAKEWPGHPPQFDILTIEL